MTKIEFNKIIDESIRRLKFKLEDNKTPLSGWRYRGCCVALHVGLGIRKISIFTPMFMKRDFEKLTKGNSSSYWFGLRNQKNYERRQNALELFRNYVISEKLYKQY